MAENVDGILPEVNKKVGIFAAYPNK